MSRFLSVIVAFAAICAVGLPARAADLDAVLRAAMVGTKAPAAGAAVIVDEKLAEIAVEGVQRIDGKDRVRPDDAWLIGSDAKPMTAAMIARLVERGLLSWNTPLSKMLPGLAVGMRPEYRAVTLDELLSHRSGLPHDPVVNNKVDDKFIDAFFDDHRPIREQRIAYVERALQDAPVAPPGTKFSYSNTGFILAATVAEHVTGLSYEDLMRRELFGPLGMASADFGTTHLGQPMGHRAGRPSTLRESLPAVMYPAGGIHLSLADWAKFCIDQLAGAKGHGKLLSAATYRRMQTSHDATGVGLDWGTDPDVLGYKGPVLEHTGSDENWYAVVVLFPATGNGILTVANAGHDMGGDTAAKATFKALLPMVSTKEK